MIFLTEDRIRELSPLDRKWPGQIASIRREELFRPGVLTPPAIHPSVY